MAKIKIIHSNNTCSGDCAGCLDFQPTDASGMPECTRQPETISREEAAKLPPAGRFTPEQVQEDWNRCEGCAFCAAFAEGACNGNR